MCRQSMILMGLLALGSVTFGCNPDDGEWPEPTLPIDVTETPTEVVTDPTPTLTATPSASEGTGTATATPGTDTPDSPTVTPSPTDGTEPETDTPSTETPTAATPTATPTAASPTPTSATPSPTAATPTPTPATDTPATPTPTATAPTDADGDGIPASSDCDDSDASTYPGATEVCEAPGTDPKDNDCDGLADDDDPGVEGTPTWYLDLDGDGYGNESAPTLTQCAQTPGYVAISGDCDDTSSAYNPGAEESECSDPNDYNCDGSTGFVDGDGDGFAACEDCNDEDSAINTGATEVCDGQDNDCDGDIDDDDDSITGQNTLYGDSDGDGFGDGSAPILTCAESLEGAVSNSDDCDDSDGAINPDSDWYLDRDGDGFGDEGISLTQCQQPPRYVLTAGDCDDGDTDFYPGAPEEDCSDPSDYNCDGSTAFEDSDGDGFAACEECDDEDAAINPGASEVCDGVDNDCNGFSDDDDEGVTGQGTFYVDGDDDGAGAEAVVACVAPEGTVSEGGDCNDDNPAVGPGADETCNSQDDDCDGVIDEDAVDGTTYYADGDEDGFGTSADAIQACDPEEGYIDAAGDCDDDDATVYVGAEELCDDQDNDCDGSADEGAEITWYLDRDDDGYGDSSVSTQACDSPAPAYVDQGGDCDESDETINPGAEEGCDGVDRNCDGAIDNDADGDGFSDGTCGGLDCDDSDDSIFPSPGGCALGATCFDILDSGRSVGSGDYVIDPDGQGGIDAFSAYCDMETDGGGWTGVLAVDSPTAQQQWFTGGDVYTWMPLTFGYDLEAEQVEAIRALSAEATQDITFHCHHVIAYYYTDGGNYDYETRWASYQGTSSTLSPSWSIDECAANDYVWRESQASFNDVDRLPVSNVQVRDAGDSNELYGVDYGDAWFR